MEKYENNLLTIKNEEKRLDKLCELNVIEQVINVAQTTILEDAWKRGQNIAVHGLIYNIKDGMLRDLSICIRNYSDITEFNNNYSSRYGIAKTLSSGY